MCSAFDPVGVNQIKLRFLEAFVAFCLLRDSPLIDATEQDALDDNHLQVARRGREPGLMLHRAGRPAPLSEWATEILDCMDRHLRAAGSRRSGASLCSRAARAAREGDRRGAHALGAHAA